MLTLFLASCNSSSTALAESEAATEAAEPVMVSAVKVKDSFPAGKYLSSGDLEVVEVDEKTLPEGYLTTKASALNRKLLQNVIAGEFLSSSMLGEKKASSSISNVSTSIARKLGYIVVTDFLDANTGEDLSDKIQEIINKNPRHTIYFPDGVYTIANPIKTSSNAAKAVSLHLSENAVIKAADRWLGKAEYMVQLGVIDETFSINETGTNYYIYGGVIDGNNKAKGLILEGGRETSIRNLSIKNATQGFKIAYNEAYGSNDSDTEWLTVEGSGFAGSIGIIVDGLDNTLSNIRVSGFEIGVQLTRGGNLIHNIQTRYVPSEQIDFANTKGFLDTSGNWYDGCTAYDFAVAFHAHSSAISFYNDCAAYWTAPMGERNVAFETDGRLSASITNFRAEFCEGVTNEILLTYADNGKGILKDPIFDQTLVASDGYKKYLVGKVVWNKD